jgi:NTP pyrophosphatase (non-canonical NTP hydrolase)
VSGCHELLAKFQMEWHLLMKENFMDTEKLLERINAFSNERDWNQFHSIKNLTMALSVESSELVEIYQWLSEEESNDQTNEVVLTRAKEELADIFIYLLRISSKLNIDLEEAVLAKMEKNEEKYPIEKAKGKSTKYTDL